ncbi:putative lipase 2 protein [Eutypa lata UCREL1]|uniref:Putative lipase 2 protein n=1 Tax=Eutypa lata (strain UCR-EL1) TaxID=1287681 RepID=M7SRH7_EUTLA|nr:putative lipase 2 protein [Eutypa lata UCREL1]
MQTVSNLQSLNINPNKGLLTAGESAGADIALAIAHLWTEAKASPPITGIYSCANSAVNKETVPLKYKENFVSFEQNAGAPMQTIEAYEFIQRNYKPDPRSHLAFPVAIPDPSIMPKTYFQACGWDIMRDCTLVMEQVWKDASVPTRLNVYPGLPHAFWILGLPIEQTRKFEADVVKGLKWLLS